MPTPGLLPLIVAIPYLLVGYLRPFPPFARSAPRRRRSRRGAMGSAARVWGLLALALLWPALDHRLGRTDGRWYGLLTCVAAISHLLEVPRPRAPPADRAFIGPWALALWGATAATLALARGLFKVTPARGKLGRIRSGLWIVAGLLLLFGVTGEIRRYFGLESLSRAAELAAGLAVSAWWLVFAAALVGYGFRRASSRFGSRDWLSRGSRS